VKRANAAPSVRPLWVMRQFADADEAVAQGIVERLSPRHAGRLLNRGICSPIARATG